MDNRNFNMRNNYKIPQKKIKYREIVSLLNPKGANNCFINVVIQSLYHTDKFKEKILKIPFNKEDQSIILNPIFRLQCSFNHYKQIQESPSDHSLDISNFRLSLSNYSKELKKGNFGDPVEVLNQIFNYIHLHDQNIELDNEAPSLFYCNNCISHEFFSIKIKDKIYCSKCNKEKSTIYDSNYFIYEIFITEILNIIKGKTSDSYKNQLFSNAKIIGRTIEQKINIEGCYCQKPEIKREIFQCDYYNPYFVINLTWNNQQPNLDDVCKVFNLISLFDFNGNLFSFEEGYSYLNKKYYLYSIILYYNNHYTCAINKGNIWYFIDDDKKNEFKSYKNLVYYLLNNHYHPIILFYSNYTSNNEINNEDVFQSEEFNELIKRCQQMNLNQRDYFINNIDYINSNDDYNYWYCSFCKKRNLNSSTKCWCCYREESKMDNQDENFYLLDCNNDSNNNNGNKNTSYNNSNNFNNYQSNIWFCRNCGTKNEYTNICESCKKVRK